MISSKFTGWHAKNCSLHNSGFFFTKEVISQREATEAKHWTFGYESIGQMFKADQEFVKCFHILGQFVLIGIFHLLCAESMILLGRSGSMQEIEHMHSSWK